MTLFEACVESLDGARAAQAAGTDRLEVCSRLDVGGLTPSEELLRAVTAEIRVPVHAMARPRAGNFVHDESEIAAIERAIDAAKRCGAAGVVFGVVDAAGRIDRAATERLVRRARPLAVTFHRAFDEARDPAAALETLIELGVERVLTSGGAPTALEGIARIAELVRRARGRIVVMAGGGVRDANARRIVAETGVSELHGSVPLKTQA